LIDKTPLSIKVIGELYGVDGKALSRQYKKKLSDFDHWKNKSTAKDYLVYKKNITEALSIDETSFSNGELYTILTNKKAKGKKGTIVAMIKGTKADVIINHLRRIPEGLRRKVTEITLDMASPMINICRAVFPQAKQVTDRFHVQKLVNEAVQDIRIKHRWDALDKENEELEKAKLTGKMYNPEVMANGDSIKQLLARSRYFLFKHYSKWTERQNFRAELLFQKYPDIQQAYNLSMKLYGIYQHTKEKGVAFTQLARWYKKVEESNFKSFNSVKRTISQHYLSILNYFDNRSTNASAESFNSKIKAFRAQFRGVRNIDFFLFRLEKLFA
jgi:transposase